MKSFGLFLFLLVLQPASAKLIPKQAWFSCQLDQDCLHLDYPCVEAVINKTYEKEARSYYQHKSLSIDCPQGPKNEPIKTSCVKNKCLAEVQTKWFQCEKDSECLHLKYDCVEAFINKRFETEARKFYQLEAQRLNCIVPAKSDKEVLLKVICKGQKCDQDVEKK